MTESRLQRWARRKAEVGKEAGQKASPAPPKVTEPEVSAEEQELRVNEALPEQELLAKYDLPDPDDIELGTDITGFLRKEIPELLRRRALRSLWKSNPVLAVLDGLNDYDEDYTTVAGAGSAVKSLYKIGQGFDRKPTFAEPGDDSGPSSSVVVPEPAAPAVQREAEATKEDAAPAGIAEKSEPQNTVNTDPAPQARTVADETEMTPAPRYRPRMRFD